ncbi:protein kinase family protein [Sansalvadorimonas sp. 2012CJ34-2]|uniref:Protein kinase family protein n=1 Tax=Parendozoicomonas callyspongiae TaxID=2942213 RepID=A0ABT0PC19_9GAMM|nr:protein kinase family protein [Sansalvadorimonas sp. 2012CJ34-2]MCL6268929.1 protein kinase family protein [Sansalvadorimonas sp. 2012CJ34-2]
MAADMNMDINIKSPVKRGSSECEGSVAGTSSSSFQKKIERTTGHVIQSGAFSLSLQSAGTAMGHRSVKRQKINDLSFTPERKVLKTDEVDKLDKKTTQRELLLTLHSKYHMPADVNELEIDTTSKASAGGTGVVYKVFFNDKFGAFSGEKGIEPLTGKALAVKVVSLVPEWRELWMRTPEATKISFAREPKKRSERLLSEVLTLKKLQGHPSIPELYGSYSFSKDMADVMVCEYILGGTLFDYFCICASDKINRAPEFYHFALQIAEGIAWIHRQGYAHFDIKPSNIMLAESKSGKETRCIKITDFGSARKLEPGSDLPAFTLLDETTEKYRAPEIEISKNCLTRVSHKADIYSLGVILQEMAKIIINPQDRWHSPSFAVGSCQFNFMKADVYKRPDAERAIELIKQYPPAN